MFERYSKPQYTTFVNVDWRIVHNYICQMRFYIFSFLMVFLFAGVSEKAFAQNSGRMTKEEYIKKYEEIAIEEMNKFGIPASITLAQGILESANGNSTLATKANNHFGIKCHKGWIGKTFHMDDDAKNECFRKYKDPLKSYKDHSKFLSTRRRYAFLFELDITDYKGWAYGLKKAGYATNPKYPQLLIKIIEDYGLYEYDKLYKTGKTSLAKKTKPQKKIVPEAVILVKTTPTGRKVYSNNGVKFIYAKKGDNPYKLAKEFNIYKYQINKYNHLTKKDTIQEGQIIYLEKKRNKANIAYHTVQPGETLYDISEKYAVRLKKLCKYNNLPKNAKLYPDQKIKLR